MHRSCSFLHCSAPAATGWHVLSLSSVLYSCSFFFCSFFLLSLSSCSFFKILIFQCIVPVLLLLYCPAPAVTGWHVSSVIVPSCTVPCISCPFFRLHRFCVPSCTFPCISCSCTVQRLPQQGDTSCLLLAISPGLSAGTMAISRPSFLPKNIILTDTKISTLEGKTKYRNFKFGRKEKIQKFQLWKERRKNADRIMKGWTKNKESTFM